MAKKSSKTVTITEEREQIMVDHTSSKITQNPTKRSAHFLKPTINPNALPPKLPKVQCFPSLSKLDVLLQYNSTPLKGWKTWVENLQETHEQAWRKAGIFDAIKCSTYHIAKDSDLILSLVEKWCPETNTFVFPWGEATVTLEDVFVLGGFSPLGVSVSSGCGSSSSSSLGKDVEQLENNLIDSYRKLKKNNKNLSHLRWQEHFMGCHGQIEYAGFLALWLVRHVFPGRNLSLVTQTVFGLAARISCGAKLALGPAILASLYRNLTVLKREIVDCLGGALIMKLSSPFQLVQVWAWERFPSLGRVPRMIGCGGMRLVRWENHGRKVDECLGDIKKCLDSARETFRWRPYGMSIENWLLPRFYVDSGTWVVVNSDEDLKLIARCLMVGRLEGLGFVERYNPHRVALQFGFDQDIPKSFDRSKAKASCTLGDVGYNKNSKGLKMYLPPRLHEGGVTCRYFYWWGTMVNVVEGTRVGCKRKKKTSKRAMKKAKKCDRSKEHEHVAIDVAENVGGESLNKSPHMEKSAQNIDMTSVFHMEIGLNSQDDTVVLEDEETEVWMDNYSGGEGSNVRGKSLNKSPHVESSQNLLQVGNDIDMTSVFHMEIGLNSQDETEVWTDNHSVGEASNNSDCNNFQGEEMDNEINISCSKLAETEPKTSVDQEECNMKLSEMLLEKKQSCDATNSLCFQVVAENQNLGNEVGQLKVTTPLITPEAGSRKSEEVSREQNKEQKLAEHNVEMDKSSECLTANIPKIVPTESEGTLIKVACEDEPVRALCQAPNQDTNHGDIIPFNNQAIVIDDDDYNDHNKLLTLCLEYEFRISRLEKQIFAMSASNRRRLAITG